MDKNSTVGLLLIGGILIGWMYFSSPSKEEIEKRKNQLDSIALVEQKKQEQKAISLPPTDTSQSSVKTDSLTTLSVDSAQTATKKSIYGVFSGASEGKKEIISIENELIKVNLSTKGGRVSSVELKNYKTSTGAPLVLFDEDSSRQELQFISNAQALSTDSFYFVPSEKSFTVKGSESKSIAFRLYSSDKTKYLEYVYVLKGNGYTLDYKINSIGLQNIIASNTSDYTLRWEMKTPSQEKSITNERAASTIYYKYSEEDADYISERKDETKSLEAKLKWVALKQQFFTSVLIAETAFEKPTDIATTTIASNKYVKNLSAELTIPYNHQANESFGMTFYFGPNHYKTLKQYNIQLEKQVPLGWGILGWVNKFLVIPIFNFLNGFNIGYGIVILILTLIIKLLLFPIAYKTYLSTAKQKILKPEIEEINAKYGNNDPLKKQQATMALYKKAGVNPLAGCIPMLLQMPILIALFRFFPASIELRQQSFLWATDLSTYDSIYDFGFSIPFYGDHISLFTLLMTLSTLLYTYSNSQMMGSQQQMPGMKFMMYAMPVMFLPIFNNYAAGLSYYYFLANMITFGQTTVIKSFVNEEELHRKIQENKKKPAKVSNFQQKLEKMARERQQLAKKK